MKTIRITWVGCHSEGESAFETLLEKGYKVTNFITLNDESFLRRSGGSRVYAGDQVALYISLDKGNNQDKVVEVAENFKWEHGEKHIRAFPEKQGLRKHILQCGDLTNEYDAVVVLEDDLQVSRAFYSKGTRNIQHEVKETAYHGWRV